MLDAVSPEYSTKEWQQGCRPRILGRYEVLGILGQGGMGTVFKGYHVTLKRFVAIKTLRLDKSPSDDQLRRFLREMETAGKMDHPNVVRATDAGENNGVLHLVMEYLPGTDLGRLVASKGALAPAEACELTRQAAAGLHYVHRTLVHRDIKPSNLMLTTDGLLKILDLGLARFKEILPEDRTPSGYVMGTYDFMAPEQGMPGGAVDARTDVYSLGCTLFKLLTGRPPYAGTEYDSPARKISAHLHVPLASVAGFASIPPEVQSVLLRMTAKNPDDRYATAADVERALTTLAAPVHPVHLLESVGEPASPHGAPLPLPHELSRLTGVPFDTSLKTPRQTSSSILARPRMVLGLLVGACFTAALFWFLVPQLLSGRPRDKDGELRPLLSKTPAKARDLDKLPGYTWHPMLDDPPISVSGETSSARLWHWDGGMQQLDATAPNALLFKLGSTTKQRFMVEASISQSPWTGRVGFFWGYTEDAEKKAAKVPNQPFAKFQMIALMQRAATTEEEAGFLAQRGFGLLSWRADGRLQVGEHPRFGQDIPRLNPGAKIFSAEFNNGRLIRAKFNGNDLPNLFSLEANSSLGNEPWQGELGFFTLEHQATFSQVRFMAIGPPSGDN